MEWMDGVENFPTLYLVDNLKNLLIAAIGGSDSSGGAGISVDESVILGHGCIPKCTISAITAQFNPGRIRITEIPGPGLRSQLESLLDHDLHAIKIGMLPNEESIDLAVDFVIRSSCPIVIVDPVRKTSSGHSLISNQGWDTLRTRLLPLADLITPNLEEAKFLVDCKSSKENVHKLGNACLELGARSVLIKGGHACGEESNDLLFQTQHHPISYRWPRVEGGTSVRGTGCRLAASIACHWATSNDLPSSIEKAGNYVQEYISGQVSG